MTEHDTQAFARVADHPEGHGTLLCEYHLLSWVRESSEELIVTSWRHHECRPCSVCLDEREAIEREQYAALSDYQRGAYDYLGQRGSTHAVCLEGAYSL